MTQQPPIPTLFPYTTLFRSGYESRTPKQIAQEMFSYGDGCTRSEEHTSELQSRGHLVCRPLLEKKKFAAIMGNCVAGGAYLPVLCDKILMTKGSGLYLAGPSLVKAAIGQIVDAEELGGAQMHAEISGTVDFFEKDDPSCLKRLRSLVALLAEAQQPKTS